jgi:GAF domain-containing protein
MQILDMAMKPVNVKHGWIALIEHSSTTLRIITHRGIEKAHPKKRIKLGEGITGWVAKEGKLLNIKDVSKDPRYLKMIKTTQSEICIPLISKLGILGIINLESDITNAFKKADESLVLALADQAAIAVETAVRLESTSVGLDQLEKLQNASQAISKYLSEPKRGLEVIVRAICDLTEADCVVIYPYDYIRKDFYDIEYVAHYGNHFPLKLSDKPRTNGLAAWVSKTKWLVKENILEEDPALQSSPFISRERIKAFIAVCLEVENNVVGVLYVDYRKPRHFTKLEEELIKTLANQATLAIYNARRYERTNEDLVRSIQELKSLREIDNAISSTLDLAEVLNRILDEGMKIVNAPTGTIQLLDQSTGELVFKAGRGMREDIRHRRIKSNEGITGSVATQKKSILAPDLREYEGSFVTVMHEQSLSELAVPIILDDRVIGVLNVESPIPNQFNKRDQSLFEALAGQSAIAIQNAQRYETTEKAYERIKEERKRFEALVSINHVIGGMQRVDEVVDALMQVMGDVLAVDNRGILLYDSSKDQLVVHASAFYRVNPDKKGEKGEIAIKVGMDSDPGLTAWTARHRESLRVDDVWKDSRYLNLISSTRSELVVPMVLGERLIGVLNLESEKPGFFTEDDQRLVEAIAGEMVLAIEKAERNELIAQQQRQAVLQKKWSQIGELASTLTHRIGNDIGLIRIYAEKLKANPSLDDDAQKQVENISTRAYGLIGLTHQFFERGMSRIFGEEHQTKRIELRETILSAIDHYPELKNFELTVSLNIEPTYFLADDRLLEEVFRELFVNAVRATPDGGDIDISAERVESTVEIRVADTGSGIPPEHTEAVFRPFRKLAGEGHGFGLWWARGFIQDLGGTITNQPNENRGKGTIFTVKLPLERSI